MSVSVHDLHAAVAKYHQHHRALHARRRRVAGEVAASRAAQAAVATAQHRSLPSQGAGPSEGAGPPGRAAG